MFPYPTIHGSERQHGAPLAGDPRLQQLRTTLPPQQHSPSGSSGGASSGPDVMAYPVVKSPYAAPSSPSRRAGRSVLSAAGSAGSGAPVLAAAAAAAAEAAYPQVFPPQSAPNPGPPPARHVAISPFAVAAAHLAGSQRVLFTPRKPPKAVVSRFSPIALLLYLAFLVAMGYYLYVRVTFTLNMGARTWYAMLVLIVELIGLTAVLPYGFLLWRYTASSGSKGLPVDDGRVILPPGKRFHARILVPCYKESLQVVGETVMAALAAAVPPGCSRTLYLCDDGADPRKEALIQSLNTEGLYKGQARYISGRPRAPGEVNGKSANLNNCLKNHVYKEFLPAMAPGAAGGGQASSAASSAAASAASTTSCAAGSAAGVASSGSLPAGLRGLGSSLSGSVDASGSAHACSAVGAAGGARLPVDVEAGGKSIQDIPLQEVVIVFDADMRAKHNFLLKVLEAMWDDSCSLVLTPQAFSNIKPGADIFNNINQQFWEYVLPGCDAWGYIACTGTNFCLRARSLATVGWFPEYSITEDYALSMELKMAGFKGSYLCEYLAVGEAPDEVRNVCRQRSRWTKGHMQIFFSRRCPLIQWRLPLIHKILYTNGTWSYFCTITTTIVFVLVPFVSLVFDYHPVRFGQEFALAATIYLPINFLLMNYVRTPQHMKSQFMASISNHVLCFTYMKAVFNTLLSIMGVKKKAGFKATKKVGGGDKPGVVAALNRLGTGVAGFVRQGSGRVAPLAAAAAVQQQQQQQHAAAVHASRMSGQVVDRYGRPLPAAMTASAGAALEAQRQRRAAAARPKKQRRGCWIWINLKTLEGALDPLFLTLSLLISLAAIAAGVYGIIRSTQDAGVYVESWDDFTTVFVGGHVDVYVLVPMLWAAYNAIPPLLFWVYFFTKGRLLHAVATAAQVMSVVLGAGAIFCLWLPMLLPSAPAPDQTVFQTIVALG